MDEHADPVVDPGGRSPVSSSGSRESGDADPPAGGSAGEALAAHPSSQGDQAHRDAGHRNEVTLVGRLGSEIRERSMPSGSLLSSFRLIVRRDSVGRGPDIDTLDCVVWCDVVQRAIRRWEVGDLVEVRGAIRRRFWRGVSGAASRCEIEVNVVRRLARATPGVSGGRRASRVPRPAPLAGAALPAEPLLTAPVPTLSSA